MVFGLGYNNVLLSGDAPAYGSSVYWILHGALLASALAVIGLLGTPLARSTFASLRAHQITVEGLFLLTASGALIASLLSTWTGEGSVYYEVVGLVLVIYTVGRKVGARTRGEALAAANLWRESFAWAQIETPSGNRRRVPVAAVQQSDRVVVLPGEPIAVDGIIVEGVGEVQETIVTGEIVPVVRGPGDRVHAGSHSFDGRLKIAPEVGVSRTLDRILFTVEQAASRPSRFQTQADRLMKGFLPLVAGASAATFAGWWWGVGVSWTVALFNAMAVLLVACPCALGLATPIAIWTGLLALSQRGLVSRDGQLLEALAHTRSWLFDKTGTLSAPLLRIARFDLQDDAIDPAWLKSAIASIEAEITHPVAQSLTALSGQRLAVDGVRVFPGLGIEGTVSGRRLRIGQAAWIGGGAPLIPEGRVVDVAEGEAWIGRIVLEEAIGDDAEEALQNLIQTGAWVRILSGDPDLQRREIGGIPVEGGLSPEHKVQIVREVAAGDPFAIFVGDGLNDAAALAAAPIGLALHGGAGLTQASAAGVIMGEQLKVLPWAVLFCRRLQSRLRGNLIFALVYNMIGIGLAAAGMLHPVVAALLMVGSSIVVSWRASRIAHGPENVLRP